MTMELGLQGARVLVTAGAGGIGRVVAEAFLEEGAIVHVCDVDDAALAALPAGITGERCDVSDRAAVAKLFAGIGELDVLVNNAGIAGPTGRVEEINPEDWDRCLEICLTGLVAGDRQRRVLEAKSQARGVPYAEVEQQAMAYASIKEMILPRQLADQILLLASTRGRTTSGQAISIDSDIQMLF
jgi:NAD(P)-dependent dehydrogenase (short-subunit alcohol dehydrogenase family)